MISNKDSVLNHLVVAKSQMLLAETSVGFEVVMWSYQAMDNLFSALLKGMGIVTYKHKDKFKRVFKEYPQLGRVVPRDKLQKLLDLWIDGRYEPIKTKSSALLVRRNVYRLETFAYRVLALNDSEKTHIRKEAGKLLGLVDLERVYTHIQHQLDVLDTQAEEAGYSGFGATQVDPLISTHISLSESRLPKGVVTKLKKEKQSVLSEILDRFTMEITEWIIFDELWKGPALVLKRADFDLKLSITYHGTNLIEEAKRIGYRLVDHFKDKQNNKNATRHN